MNGIELGIKIHQRIEAGGDPWEMFGVPPLPLPLHSSKLLSGLYSAVTVRHLRDPLDFRPGHGKTLTALDHWIHTLCHYDPRSLRHEWWLDGQKWPDRLMINIPPRWWKAGQS